MPLALEHHTLPGLEFVAVEFPGEAIAELKDDDQPPRALVVRNRHWALKNPLFPMISVSRVKQYAVSHKKDRVLRMLIKAAHEAEKEEYKVFTITG